MSAAKLPPTNRAPPLSLLPAENNVNDLNQTAGADLRMAFLPAKLREAGYATSMIGKSHLGARSIAHLPIHRGFDQHFGFLGGGEDHFTQVSGEDPVVGSLVDLWRDHGPAYGENGTFSGFLYSAEAERVIQAHAATHPPRPGNGRDGATPPGAGIGGAGNDSPLFMYLAWHLVHSPLEAPVQYFDKRCADNTNRQLYHAMVTALDDGVGNVTRALRQTGMYDNTLLIFYADNGGPLVTTGRSGNNYPLKGGKTDDFEGGTRSVAFLGGGALPAGLRGSVNQAYIHACDWYATLCGLAGVDPADPAPGVPPIDSLDQWATILKPNATWADGPRQEMVVSYNMLGNPSLRAPSGPDAALIQGRYKIVTGHQGGSGFWTGPVHPNSTGPADPTRNATACGPFSCCEGCLYDIIADPSEHTDLRVVNGTMSGLYEHMHARLLALANSTFQTAYIQPGITCLSAEQAKIYWKGFRGPPCFNSSQLPVVPTPPPTSPPTPRGDAFQLKSPGEPLCLTGARLGVKRCSPGDPPQWRVGDASTGELEYAADGNLGFCLKMHEESGWNCANTDANKTAAFIGHCSGAGGTGAHRTNYFDLRPAASRTDISGSAPETVLIKSHDCPELCLARLGTGAGAHSDGNLVGASEPGSQQPEVGLAACSGDRRASVTWVRS